jgi:hypothetical protein
VLILERDLTRLEASPLVIFSLLGGWGIVFLIRNWFREDAFYTVRTRRFTKRVAPTWFALWTLFFLVVAGLFVGLPIAFLGSLRS